MVLYITFQPWRGMWDVGTSGACVVPVVSFSRHPLAIRHTKQRNDLPHNISIRSTQERDIYEDTYWLLSVEGNHRFCASYTPLNLVHRTILPRCPVMTSKWWNDSTISLKYWECKKYLTFYVIITSSVNEKGQLLHICKFFSPIHVYFTWNHGLQWKLIYFKPRATV